MHIAIVAGGYSGLSGAFTNARELAEQLAARGEAVTVLAPDVPAAHGTEHLRFVRIRDRPLVPQNLFYFTALERAHRRRRIDVVHTYDSIAFLAVCPFARLHKVPTVFSVQASIFSQGRAVDYSWLTTQILKFTNRFAARQADRLICISQEMVRCMRYAGASERKIVVIPNPVDLSLFHPGMHKKDGRTCLYVGALRPAKGLEYLIEAIPQVLGRFPDARFIVVGDGPQRGEIERLITNYQIAGAVHMVGSVPHGELLPYYQQADLFVIPSLNEPQGIVVLEAMACGLPVVASRVGGIPEMVKDEYNGLLMPPGDSQALARATLRLFTEEDLYRRCAANALDTAKEFSWQRNIGKYEEVFRQVSTDSGV